MGILIAWLSGFIIGVIALFAYMVVRMMRNKDWDNSNMTNAARLLSHVVLHPHDFGRLRYVKYDIDGLPIIGRQPFWYVSKDELSEVVRSRPSDAPTGHAPEQHDPD